MNKLIFGRDETKGITNITIKDETCFLYTEDGVESFPYSPFVLSHKKANAKSERLKGDQYWKYITSVSCDKFNELRQKYQRDLWLPRNLEDSVMLEMGYTYYKGLKVADVSILSFDIETSGLVMDSTSRVFLISNTFRKNGQITKKLFSIDDYENQFDMLEAWCAWVREVNPSIITGHNILSYDLPYLNNIGFLKLGKDGSDAEFEEKTSKFRKDGSQKIDYNNIKITGRDIVDTFFLSMKYDQTNHEFASYGLKPIIKHLGLEKKDRQFYDAKSIAKNWNNKEEREKIKQYAIDDSDDALKLFDIMVPPFFYLAQSIPKTMQQIINEASGSHLDALMIRSYLQDGYSQPMTSGREPFEGAISMGIPGVYDWVCKADVASLYPSIMLEYNIHDTDKDPNNHMIQMLTYYREERLKNKKLAKETGDKYFDHMQDAQKRMINSLYGFLGSGFLLYNYPKGAAEVTKHGREILLKGVEFATGHTLEKTVKAVANEGSDNEEISYEWKIGDKVNSDGAYSLVNVDTDSFSITQGRNVDRNEFTGFLEKLNQHFPKLIRWEDDGIYEKVIVLRAKNYVLVKDGEVKLKGSAVTDQKKEPALTEMLKEMIQSLLDDESAALPFIYRKYIREALEIKDIHRWATKKTVTKSVLDPDRLTEQKVLNAINEAIDAGIIEGISEGDKIWLYNSVNGEVQAKTKGLELYYKDGRPKMVPNYVLHDVRLFDVLNRAYDREHYLDRVHSTVQILANVVNTDLFPNYNKKKYAEQLKELTNAG